MNVPAPTDPIRIMIIDRDKLLREGLRTLMLDKPTLSIVSEADNGPESVAIAKHAQPDIILLTVDPGAQHGLEVLPTLIQVSSRSRVIVLTQTTDAEEHRKAMILGAMGVVLKDFGSEVLFKAIEKVHAGEIWFDRSQMARVLKDIRQNGEGKPANPTTAKIATLTPREREVIALVSLGLKNRDIGERLFICETTVRHHLTSVFEKLDVSNRLELIIFAFSQGLANLPDKLPYQGNRGADTVDVLEVASPM